ncbi:hypothetical protein Tco_1286820 [Tanacetum coccineum]
MKEMATGRENPLSVSEASSSLTIVDDRNMRILDGMKLETNGKTEGKHLMTSWKSENDPTPGNFVVGLSAERPPQIFTWNGSNSHRRGGPWDGGKFVVVLSRILGTLN